MYRKPSSRPNSNLRVMDHNGASKRVYQVWKGSNRFFLGGRLIFGPDARSLVLTICLIVIPVILFGSFVCRNLIFEIHSHFGEIVLLVASIYTAYVIILLLLTSGRDPGIIPRNTHPPEPEDETDMNLPTEWAVGQGPTGNLPPTKDVTVNGFVIKVKYCQTCMLYRPPRCSHCSICNNCVERFDHHCPWVGQCIGVRNYSTFFMFISSTTLLCIYVFAFCWVNIRQIMRFSNCSLWRALLASPVSGILILYKFIGMWFVGGLTAFHLYLVSSNQTTYENFRYRYNGKMNPHNLGLWRNLLEIFTKIPPSRNDFRRKVKDEQMDFAASLGLGHALRPESAQRRASLDIEIGGKRQTVDADDLTDMQSQMDGGGVAKSGIDSPHKWGKANWEMTPDLKALATELGTTEGKVYR